MLPVMLFPPLASTQDTLRDIHFWEKHNDTQKNLESENIYILEKKSKHYYTLLISTKAKFSNNAQVLKRDFNLNEEQLKNCLSCLTQ